MVKLSTICPKVGLYLSLNINCKIIEGKAKNFTHYLLISM
jgi:hypothetical protein